MHSVSVNRLLQCLMAKRWQALTLLLFLGMQTAYAQDSMTFTKVIRCESQNPERTKGQDCFNPPADLGLGDIVLAQGKIERKSEDGFGEAVKNLPAGTIVVLNSMGGDLVGGLRLGQSIRARDFNTWVMDATSDNPAIKDKKNMGRCFSSCAYTFLGGVLRRVDKAGQLGVHQFRNTDDKLDANQAQKISAMLARYLDTMGINRQLLDQALLTEPGKMTLIPETQRIAWNIEPSLPSTVTLSKWKLEAAAGGKRLAYTSVKQINRNAFLTFALTYVNGSLRGLVIAKPDARDELASDWLSAFNDKVEVMVEVNSKLLVMQPLGNWELAGQVNTPGTRQIWYAVKPELIKELLNARQFKLKLQWAIPPMGMDAETTFSTDGLKDNYAAL
ncbi:MAG: hypothetical protein EBU92_06650 [Betaproteobacteria bacterium]|jgi:hypothetical protein|nr:hypothetical protein [Betaproteobacteria bacterium]